MKNLSGGKHENNCQWKFKDHLASISSVENITDSNFLIHFTITNVSSFLEHAAISPRPRLNCARTHVQQSIQIQF